MNIKTISISFLLITVGQLLLAQEQNVESLGLTYDSWVRAWNDRDAAGVAEISWGNFGFGRDTPFPRSGSNDQMAYQNGIQRYMDSMETLDYKVYYSNVRIVDQIGLIDGYYAQTTKPRDGSLRTVYGRQSLIFSWREGRWKMIHYHRSALPNEFIR